MVATMKWFLLFLLLLAVVVAVGVAWQRSETRWAGNEWRAHRKAGARPPQKTKCLPCHGTGWLGREPERTLNFAGDSFEDRHAPATMCSACGGTGIRTRQ
jgi:hypothetical protein